MPTRRPRLSTLLLLGALLLSMGSAALVHAHETQRENLQFQVSATDMQRRLEARLEVLVALLRGVAALHAALGGEVSDPVFGAYFGRLRVPEELEGVLGLAVARRVLAEDLAAFEAAAGAAHPGFHVFPRPPEDRDAWVVRTIEPLNGRNAAALGFDMGSEVTRRVAMESAARSGRPALTGPVTLVQEITPDKQVGFLMYVPIYRGGGIPGTQEERLSQVIGMAYAALRAGDFFEISADRPDLAFEVTAVGGGGAPALVFRSGPPEPGWAMELPLVTGSTGWVVRYTAPRPVVTAVGVGALALGLPLSLALWAAARTAEARAEERNRLLSREAAVARAVGTLQHGSADVTAMVERFADWLSREGLATGLEAWFKGRLAVSRGSPGDGPPLRREFDDDYTLLVHRPVQRVEHAAQLEAATDRVSWLIERAVLHEKAHRALERNEAALRFADVFLGVLGHDLRNPLHAVSVGVKLLDRLEPTPDQQRVLARIRSSADRMSRLIDQILDFTRARIGGGIPVHPVRCDVAQVTEDLLWEARMAAPGREMTLERSGDTHACADPDRLAQSLSNLLGNAVQHGEEGAIEVVVDGSHQDEVAVWIRNRGVIPPEVLPRVFDPFRSGATRAGHLGLGMYITRMVVEAHGGRIGIRSDPERGTEVEVHLRRKGPSQT